MARRCTGTYTPINPPIRTTTKCFNCTSENTEDCYSDEALNMRRKAETLKYNKHRANLTTNKQKWSRLSTDMHSNARFIRGIASTSTNTEGNIILCNNNSIIESETFYSDVPGKVQKLFLDGSVPLTLYTPTNIMNGGFNQPNNMAPVNLMSTSSPPPYLNYHDYLHAIEEADISANLTSIINVYGDTLGPKAVNFTKVNTNNGSTEYVPYMDQHYQTYLDSITNEIIEEDLAPTEVSERSISIKESKGSFNANSFDAKNISKDVDKTDYHSDPAAYNASKEYENSRAIARKAVLEMYTAEKKALQAHRMISARAAANAAKQAWVALASAIYSIIEANNLIDSEHVRNLRIAAKHKLKHAVANAASHAISAAVYADHICHLVQKK